MGVSMHFYCVQYIITLLCMTVYFVNKIKKEYHVANYEVIVASIELALRRTH